MARAKKTNPAIDAVQTGTAQEPEAAEQIPTTPLETGKQDEAAPKMPETAERKGDPPQRPQEVPQDEPEPEGDANTTGDGDAPQRPQDELEPEGDTNTTGNGDAPQGTQDEPERDIFADIPNPCVYCGPTVRGVTRQYTTYQGGIPDELRDFIKKHPQARKLIVSPGQFANLRKRLDTPGTPEAELYKQIRREL